MKRQCSLSRRDFLGATLAVGSALGTLTGRAEEAAPTAAAPAPSALERKIKIGLIGAGGRGNWIAALFKQHGGYEIHAVADYFPEPARAVGDRFGVESSRRFSGLSGYKRLLESGVEAVAIESPPYFHPEQAAAAVDAGKHVYCAKPVAVDVPGCRTVEASGRKATANKLAFVLDFQTRTDEFYREAIRRVHAGDAGKLAFMEATYHADSPWTRWLGAVRNQPADPETRLRAWGLDKALSGDMITEQNIHTLDVVNWIAGSAPTHAMCECGLTMRDPVGSCADHFAGYFQFPDGVGVTFSSRQSNGHGTKPDGIRVRAFCAKGVLETEYGGSVLLRGERFYAGGKSPSIYMNGAVANIAAFYEHITQGNFGNVTVAPSVQSNLIAILGRTAAYRGELAKWDDMLAANERMEADLRGLKD